MLKSISYIVLLGGLMLGTVVVQAQDAPRPNTLVRAWLTAQSQRARDLERVELQEQAQWTLDGPFGVQQTQLLANVVGIPDSSDWQRTPISVRMNDQDVPPERWIELEQRRRSLMGSQADKAASMIVQLHRLIGRMRPAGPVAPDDVAGIASWRVELVPRNPQEPIERYTIWFDQNNGHLIRSRALVRARRAESPFIITTAYTRVQGFEVPARRRMEGTVRTRRRMRTYTMLFTYEAVYTDYRFFYESK